MFSAFDDKQTAAECARKETLRQRPLVKVVGMSCDVGQGAQIGRCNVRPLNMSLL
jgi:hypothetical protein